MESSAGFVVELLLLPPDLLAFGPLQAWTQLCTTFLALSTPCSVGRRRRRRRPWRTERTVGRCTSCSTNM